MIAEACRGASVSAFSEDHPLEILRDHRVGTTNPDWAKLPQSPRNSALTR